MTDVVPAGPASRRPSPRLSPEVEAWKRELVTLWDSVGMSMNRFAAGNPIDKGTVSRYLSGQRVPREPWFLNRLLALRAEQGTEVAQEVREHLTQLQLAALQAAHPGEYRVRLVSDELELAEASWRQAERYAKDLEEQIADLNRQIDELTLQQAKLQGAWDTDRAAQYAEQLRLQQHIDELRQEIATVAEHLDYGHRRTVAAEQQCRDLEELLGRLTADNDAGSTDQESLAVSHRLVAAADDARRAIAMDLHDGAQPKLHQLRLALSALRDRTPEELPGGLDHADQLVDETLSLLDDLEHGIYPRRLPSHGLGPAIEKTADRFDLAVRLSVPAERLPDTLEKTIYFFVSEALTNARKYTGTDRVWVNVRRVGAWVIAEVRDDGIGGASPDDSGLAKLRDRIAAHGGRLDITSVPRQGTHLTAWIPCA